ncbi:hypothetical protein [Erythrobacter sp. YT30]|uniref:hypothetical protein n=1 Tax=Erythrobacter sp. YT30 TaxID=1735012 RepID=UPI00076C744F|nr:hypothetical protein [Erythrobacter sp. YT30]KWV93101.1 hypothetical protein AUC45_02970 [Erythrobacter sp. YT30]
MSVFHQTKLLIMQTVGLEKDALHIYVALLVFMLACVLMRWRASSWKPWFVVLIAAIAGEVWDVHDSIRLGNAIVVENHWKDLWNTMLLPTVLFIAARYSQVFQRTPKGNAASSGDARPGEAA